LTSEGLGSSVLRDILKVRVTVDVLGSGTLGGTVHIGDVSGQSRWLTRRVDLVGNSSLKSNRNRPPAATDSVRTPFFGETANHGLDESMRFAPPLPSYIEHEGEESASWIPQMFLSFTPLDASKSSPTCTLSNGGDHRHVDTYLTEPRIGENDVKAGTLVNGVPMGDFLFLLWMPSDVCKPVMECIADVVMSLRDPHTDIASSGMSATIVAVDSAADSAAGSCMMTDTRRPLNFLNAEAPTQCGAEIAIIHWGSAFFRNEVGTRFWARPKRNVNGFWNCETAMELLECLGIDLC